MASPRPFTPTAESPADLAARTVGRTEILATIAQRLDSAATGRARPHTLLVGPRGCGKTHLLRVALHQLRGRPQVRDRLVIADLPEDVVGITRYADLVWEIGTALGLSLPRSADVVAQESAVLDAVGDRVLVLVVENLDRVFRSIGRGGQQNLRSLVETSGRVLVLAASPALFAGLQDRNEPWFAGMITTPVDGLDPEEVRRLLSLLARQRGEDGLADFLESGSGRARVQAAAALTGGSARIWMVLSECISIGNLDALVPSVHELVEKLVPYYQQLLWDLPANHQAIVRRLAEGADASATAADIAEATGLTPQTVSAALGILQQGRWVRSEKLPSDRRQTWYSLREPMLRHHFQWRATRGEPLRLVVELLRSWYAAPTLRAHLADAQPGSAGEAHLLSSLAQEPRSFDVALNSRVTTDLAVESRRWITGEDEIFPPDCGRYVELCLALAMDPGADPTHVLARREPTASTDHLALEAVGAAGGSGLGELLCAVAAGLPPDETRAGIALVAAGWIGREDPLRAERLLTTAAQSAHLPPATDYAIHLESCFWRGQHQPPAASLSQLSALLPLIVRDLGADHAIGLSTRSLMAHHTAACGDPVEALRLQRGLLADTERVLGHDHPDTLATRHQIAYYTGACGDPAGAVRGYQLLLPDRERVRGAAHPDTLSTRLQLAAGIHACGDPAGALRRYLPLVHDSESALGPEHAITRAARWGLEVTLREAAGAPLGNTGRDEAEDDSTPPGAGAEALVIERLVAAFRGDAEARIKLPQELRRIVDSRVAATESE